MRTLYPGYRKGRVTSSDGTTIGYRTWGSGPVVIVVHGGMQSAQHFTKLAAALAGDFTVCVPDRRGRGLSGPHGAGFTVQREVGDVQALVATTGATRIFGLSSGGLVTLRTALATPALDRVAVYDPPMSVNGSVPTAWLPRYHRQIAAGRTVSAMVTALKGIRVDPAMSRIPRWVLVPGLSLAVRLQREPSPDDVPIADLVPTEGYDMQIVQEMADTVPDYAALQAKVLLLGGATSPPYFATALDALSAVLPQAGRVTFPGLGHSGPDDDGDPARVGEVLRDFFLGNTLN
ncbi:alpha/beta hydrolase [Streptosporangiaceae bacterium NEAU-GS5]|nr:alpha/beta hydrolase [Streptosporangiaceae bacterium NEAU-GS5]